MATILFAWELGANLGHLIPLSRIAKALDGEGHRAVYALRDIGNARAVLGDDTRVVQAPIWPLHKHFGAISGGLASYADILTAIGFGDPQKVAAVAAAWQSLIDYVRPDVVVADHSPALHVLLHGTGIRIVDIGTGFTMPPLDYDFFPPLRGDLAPAVPESRLFESLRDARNLLKLPRPSGLIEAFRSPYRVVFGLPELDPYQGFRREPVVAPPGGLPPAMPWPRERRLFVYAGTEMTNFESLLQALAVLESPVEIYLRGDAGPAREFLRMRGITVHDTPPDLATVLKNASHILSQGGAGTIAAAYSAGRPQLVVPAHDEAEINAEMLVRSGVGQTLAVTTDPSEIAARIAQFMAHPLLPDNALELANRIARRPLPDGASVAAAALKAALA
jgi:hypothetical protein